MSLSRKKVFRVVVVLLFPAVAVYLGAGDALRVSDRPSEYIGLTFSILAASLFATISIVGDPSMLLSGGWRTVWEGAKEIQLRLMRLTYLFVLYLFVLALLVVSEIVESLNLDAWYFIHDVFAFMSILAFILSFWLPFELKEIQITRLEKEIERRKKGGAKDGQKKEEL